MSNTIFAIDTTAAFVHRYGEDECEHACYVEVSCEPYNDGFLYDVDICDPANGYSTSQFTTRKEAERKAKWYLNLYGIEANVKFAPEMERGAKETCAIMFRERGVSKHETVQRVVHTCGDGRYIKWRGWWLELDADNIAEL